MANKMMNKAEALEEFKHVHGDWIKETIKKDRAAVKFEWSTYVDGMEKAGMINPERSYSWTNPFASKEELKRR